MRKSDVVKLILQDKIIEPKQNNGLAFAPTNIALCKYWGKRDNELNLPNTASLSIALKDKGSMCKLAIHDKPYDTVSVNNQLLNDKSPFVKRLVSYLDLFRQPNAWHFIVDIQMNIPVAAGLASSACGFASLVCALNDLYQWALPPKQLSILARLGSGSAARSLWDGFVEWHAGIQPDGLDSFAEPIDAEWPSLCVGILTLDANEKPIPSRDAMLQTVNSSALYGLWPKKVAQDLVMLKRAIEQNNFALLAGTAESNALTMHATMLSSWPPICYYLPETIANMQKIWQLRQEGLPLYFTQDAGPNLKLLFELENRDAVQAAFPTMELVNVFGD